MKALKTIKSKALAPGDTVKIIAPSSPFEKEHLEKGILWLKKMGFEVSYDERIFEKTRYLAGSHKNRADEINSAFADSMVKAIVCARGGYGAIGILPFLDLETIKKNSKIFLGCSDVDFHVPKERVQQTAEVFRRLGGEVTKRLYPNMDHTINQDEIDFVRGLMRTLVTSF